MAKKSLYRIIFYFMRLCHFLLVPSLLRRIASIRTVVYSLWISSEFGSCGEHCSFNGFRFLKDPQNVYLGSYIFFGKSVIVETYDHYLNDDFCPNIKIGDYSLLGDHCHITCVNRIEIGNHVIFGRYVFITDNSHGKSEAKDMIVPPLQRHLYSKGPVIIEDNVWIGEKVTILPNVRIGYGSIIGANSVITKNVPKLSIVVGNPQRVIKQFTSSDLK